MKHFGKYLINKIREVNPHGVPEQVGCSDEEIKQLMKAQKVSQLPSIYREYLEVMGKKGVMSIHAGSDWSFQRLLRMKQNWQDSLDMLKYDFLIPEKTFVFFQHGGYEYRYFISDDNSKNPPVYVWEEDESEVGYHVYPRESLRQYFESYIDFYSKNNPGF